MCAGVELAKAIFVWWASLKLALLAVLNVFSLACKAFSECFIKRNAHKPKLYFFYPIVTSQIVRFGMDCVLQEPDQF